MTEAGYTICEPWDKLENVFVKHYAPNHKPANKDNRGIIQVLWDLSKSWPGHLHLQHKLYAWYHDPSSSGSPVLFTSLIYCTKCKSEKGDNSAKINIYRILTKFNLSICTLHSIFMPNIINLVQAVLHIHKVLYGLNAYVWKRE